MMRRPHSSTLEEISRRTGYHISTVSRVLNYSAKIPRRTAELILAVARDVGYFRYESRRIVALLLPENGTELAQYTLGLINAFRQTLGERGYRMELIAVDQAEILSERSVCGIISIGFNEPAAELLTGRFNLPVVCVNDFPRHIDGVYSVFSDESGGMESAVAEFVAAGHRRIGLILNGNPENCANRARRDAFEAARRKFRLSPESRCVHGNREERGRVIPGMTPAVMELTQSGISAIINSGEGSAAEFLHVCNNLQLRVPRDLSVITWEMSGVSAYWNPPVTTVGQNFPALTQAAVDMLEPQLCGKDPGADRMISYLLRRRESVAPPPERYS